MQTPKEIIAGWLQGSTRAGNEPQQAALIISKLSAAGFVIVPKEATPKMQSAGGFYHIQGGGAVTDADLSLAKQSWHAMVEAWRRDNG